MARKIWAPSLARKDLLCAALISFLPMTPLLYPVTGQWVTSSHSKVLKYHLPDSSPQHQVRSTDVPQRFSLTMSIKRVHHWVRTQQDVHIRQPRPLPPIHCFSFWFRRGGSFLSSPPKTAFPSVCLGWNSLRGWILGSSLNRHAASQLNIVC